MTWVVGIASVIFGAVISDVRVARLVDGELLAYATAGLQKLHVLGERTLCGFSGEIDSCFSAVEDLRAWIPSNGGEDRQLLEQVKEWVAGQEVRKHAAEFLFVRPFIDEEVDLVMAAGVKAQLSSIAEPSAVATPFLMVDHIGSGSQVPAFGKVVDEIKGSLSGWVGFEQAAPGSGARIIVQSVSDVIRRSDQLTVSPELDVCLVSHAGRWCSGYRAEGKNFPVATTPGEFRRLVEREDRGVAVAVIA